MVVLLVLGLVVGLAESDVVTVEVRDEVGVVLLVELSEVVKLDVSLVVGDDEGVVI